MQLLDERELVPEWRASVLAQDATHRYLIVHMGYNHRLIGIGLDDPEPVYGWCFKSYQAALAGLMAWNPDTQDEPLFWHKRAGATRRAPQRDHNSRFNGPRCVHGSYILDGKCDIDPFCDETNRQGSP